MGRVVTPTYRVEYQTNAGYISPAAWDCRRDGRPTEVNAEKHRQALNRSFQPGEINGHCGGNDVVMHVSSVRIVRQSTGEVVVEAAAPAFEVL